MVNLCQFLDILQVFCMIDGLIELSLFQSVTHFTKVMWETSRMLRTRTFRFEDLCLMSILIFPMEHFKFLALGVIQIGLFDDIPMSSYTSELTFTSIQQSFGLGCSSGKPVRGKTQKCYFTIQSPN